VRRHPFDPVSLVFGLAFATAAVIVLAGGELVDDGQFLLPATLLGLGVALLVQNARRTRPADDGPYDPHPGSGSDSGHDAHGTFGPDYGAADAHDRDDAGAPDPDLDAGLGPDADADDDDAHQDAASTAGSGTSSDEIDWSAFAPDEPPRRGTVEWPGT
jgi:hypothetical protein